MCALKTPSEAVSLINPTIEEQKKKKPKTAGKQKGCCSPGNTNKIHLTGMLIIHRSYPYLHWGVGGGTLKWRNYDTVPHKQCA